MLESLPYPVLMLIAVAAGTVAGAVNTLAGSGSLITLPALMMLGLPPTVANGTNRVGIVVQNIVGVATLWHGGKLDLSGSRKLALPVVVGAIGGAMIAVNVGDDVMNLAIAAVMVVMLFVVLLRPKQWLRQEREVNNPNLMLYVVLLGVGIYGGFIQAGVGVLFLVVLVVGAGYDAVSANAVKLFVTLLFTIAAVPIFAAHGQVDWGLGALMAVGQATGAFVAGRFAVTSDNATIWIRRILIVVAAVSAAKLTGLF